MDIRPCSVAMRYYERTNKQRQSPIIPDGDTKALAEDEEHISKYRSNKNGYQYIWCINNEITIGTC